MTTARHHHVGDRGRRGFSLAELVLALGILAIGLTMAAALFPAAIKLNELSTNDSVGTIVATNGLAIARSVLKSASFSGDPNDLSEASGVSPDLLLCRPDPNAPTTRGVLILGRPIVPTDPNGPYQLVIVAYDKYTPGSTVQPQPVTVSNPTTSGGAPAVTLTRDAAVGSPLIVKKNGSYAKIIEFNTTTREATLDHMIDLGPPPVPATVDAFVIVDSGAPGKNCVMTVLVAETLLRP
jgi:prepilin-type N-terminal cleavage/methylation domain-containing protein